MNLRTLTPHEQRTIRMAGVLLAVYLTLFYGVRVWKYFEASRVEYTKLVREAEKLKQELRAYENKAALIEELKEKYHLVPGKLVKATLVSDASAAIQKAATSGGIQLGPLRESPAHASAKELASMQLEAMGPIPAVTGFMHRLETLGYPLIIDSIQISPEQSRPGMIKLNLTLVILDFEQWKTEEGRHA
jgi:hypothetical protein